MAQQVSLEKQQNFKFSFKPPPMTNIPGPLHLHNILAKDIEDEENISVESTYNHKTLEHVEWLTASHSHSLVAKFDITESKSLDFLIEDIIVEYKPISGKVETYTNDNQKYTCSYLKTYVSVGIPIKRYNWILDKASQTKALKSSCKSKSFLNGYAWISAEMTPNVNCKIYTEQTTKDAVTVGSLTNVMNNLKSNVRGYGRFEIQVMNQRFSGSFLKFVLTEFYMIDHTDISGTIKPPPSAKASQKLIDSLAKVNLITESK